MGILDYDCKKSRFFNRAKPNHPGDEIVLTGIAGRFPNSCNMKEFADNLYNKVCSPIRLNNCVV